MIELMNCTVLKWHGIMHGNVNDDNDDDDDDDDNDDHVMND